MKLSDIRVDAAKGEAGAWVRDLPGLPGVALKVRGIDNTDWRRVMAREMKTLPRVKRMNIDPAETERITTRCLIEAGIVDWAGIEGEDGKPLTFSAGAADLLADPDYAELRNAALYACGVVSRDGIETLSDILGN